MTEVERLTSERDSAVAETERLRDDAKKDEHARSDAYQRLVEDRDLYRQAFRKSDVEAGRAREALHAIRELRNTATGWHVYETRDAGDCYDAGAVDDFLAALDAALDGEPR